MDTDALRQIPDPAERVKAVNQALHDTRAELISIRREAVREMRKSMSLAQIADQLGVTRSRVQQYAE